MPHPADKSTTRSPRRAAKLAALLVPFVVFFAALEIALRAAPRAIPIDLLEHFEPQMRARIAARRKLTTHQDTVLVERTDGGLADRMWIYRPGVAVTHDFDEPGIVPTVVMDEMGFCNPATDAYARHDRFDVIAIGDSFTWCTTVAPDETFTAELGRRTGLSVYNLGMPGRGLYEYLQLLEHFGLAKQPRFVVMLVYEGNDFRDAYLFHEARAGADASLTALQCPFDSAAACSTFVAIEQSAIGRTSYAYNLVAAAVQELAEQLRKREIDFQYTVRLADGATVAMNSRNGDRDEVAFARRLVDASLDTSMFDVALEHFAELAAEHRFVPIVLYAPSAYTAYADISTFDDVSIEQTMRSYSDTLRAYFARRSAQLDLRYRDLTPMLQAAASRSTADDLLYFRTNVHFAQAGHALVANELSAMITAGDP